MCDVHREYTKMSWWELFTGLHYADKVIWYGLGFTLLICAFIIL